MCQLLTGNKCIIALASRKVTKSVILTGELLDFYLSLKFEAGQPCLYRQTFIASCLIRAGRSLCQKRRPNQGEQSF